MADFPGSIFVPREVANIPGREYDAADQHTSYAEDYSLPAAEIVAIEETLGEDPQGDFDTVVERLEAITPQYPSRPGQSSSQGGFGIPGTFFTTATSGTHQGNRIYYSYFQIEKPIEITQLKGLVFSAPGAARNIRVGIYAADEYNQPVGAPIYDSGDIAIGSSFTGEFGMTGLSITLQKGRYLIATASDGNIVLRYFVTPTQQVRLTNASNSMEMSYYVSSTYGALPTPGTAWNTVEVGTFALQHKFVMKWNPA